MQQGQCCCCLQDAFTVVALQQDFAVMPCCCCCCCCGGYVQSLPAAGTAAALSCFKFCSSFEYGWLLLLPPAEAEAAPMVVLLSCCHLPFIYPRTAHVQAAMPHWGGTPNLAELNITDCCLTAVCFP